MQPTHPPHVLMPAHGLRRRIWPLVIAWLSACVLTLGSGLARADSDHDRARQALQAGEVLPLTTILARVEREHAGKVLDVELERDKDDGVARWVYKVKVLTPDGTRLKLQMDAKSGELISRKLKD
ncbi:MAG: PepSY domain-containing protein [Rhodoferax sp.]|nr:PepSY domain-containing protein [Rhodoferax sp.]